MSGTSVRPSDAVINNMTAQIKAQAGLADRIIQVINGGPYPELPGLTADKAHFWVHTSRRDENRVALTIADPGDTSPLGHFTLDDITKHGLASDHVDFLKSLATSASH